MFANEHTPQPLSVPEHQASHYVRPPSTEEVYNIVREAKNRLNTGDFAGTRRALTHLENVYGKLAESEEKRLVGYNIKELKTNLKLALLA